MANLKAYQENEKLTIDELKAKYGVIFKLEIPMSDGEQTDLIVKKVGRREFDAGSKILQKNEIQGLEFFLRALTIQGDPETVIADFDAMRSAGELMADIISVKAGNVTRL
jgi:hypothetical protein